MLVDDAWVGRLIAEARREDLGGGTDVTSVSFVPERRMGKASVVVRGEGGVSGVRLIERVCKAYDDEMSVRLLMGDGATVGRGAVVATVEGKLRSILAAERVLLNFVCYLSGIATATRRYVERIAGTKANIYDTRKTLPGYRGLAKYAVRCGGGCCHRLGLDDAVLVKDTHIAGLGGAELAAALRRGIEATGKMEVPPDFVEVEVDTLEQLAVVLGVEGVEIVLLDNMSPAILREAAAMRDRVARGVQLEASGGVTLETVRAIAETGVERISAGALTHSVTALDMALDIVDE
jgi:nicotinate-nucleotide pyrophosphorylase (carboxylating)